MQTKFEPGSFNAEGPGQRIELTVEQFNLLLRAADSDVEVDGGRTITDWWGGTVVLSFVPVLAALIFGFWGSDPFNLLEMIGKGELILSSFAVSTPSVIRQYNSRNNRLASKGHFYLSLFWTIIQLIIYASIKTNLSNIPLVVYVTSFTCVAATILFSYLGERRLLGGKQV